MSSDLSRSLVDAAAEALREAGFVDSDDDTVPTFAARPWPFGRIDVWKPVECAAEAAVAAVLETLAANDRNHKFGYSHHDLNRSAAEVKTEEGR